MSLADRSTRPVLISAWNDSGGGFLHRLLDGHSGLAAWPFELQLGNGGRTDSFSTLIGGKYRWPLATLSAAAFFDSLADDELKSVLIHPETAKHREFPVGVRLAGWRAAFLRIVDGAERRSLIAAYIDSFMALWLGDVHASGFVAHCPNLVIDTHEILADFPDTKLIHVARDPLAGIGDFRRRHPDFPVSAYAARWSAVNVAALEAHRDFPAAVLLVSFGELAGNREATMRRVAEFLELPFEESMLQPCWNGKALDEIGMGPFGGVPQIGLAREAQLKAQLGAQDRQALLEATDHIRQALGLS